MLERLELKAGDFARIRRHCDSAGIEFLATPLAWRICEFSFDLGIRAIKIASPDIINRPLLEAAVQTGLPILLSTGRASQERSIGRTVCCSRPSLPAGAAALREPLSTKLEQANLRRIATLQERYGCPVGFSDHTAETFTGAAAGIVGASVLEKHFTLDRGQSGPDHAFSQTPGRLAEYIRLVRQAEVALGSGSLDLGEPEGEVRLVSRCSVTAGQDIPAGTLIGRDMLVVKRPGSGISPWQIEAVVGHVANCNIPADTPMTWEMVRGGDQ